MNRPSVTAAYRAGFGILGVGAIATQLVDLTNKGVLSPVNFFSYFTILSNSLAVAVLLVGAARWNREPSRTMDLLRGAAVIELAYPTTDLDRLHPGPRTHRGVVSLPVPRSRERRYGSVAVVTLVILAGGAVLCVITVLASNPMRDRARPQVAG